MYLFRIDVTMRDGTQCPSFYIKARSDSDAIHTAGMIVETFKSRRARTITAEEV